MSPRVTGKNLTRIVGRQIFPGMLENPDRGMAPALQIGRMSVPESAEAEWNEWYNTEYIPGYLTVPSVIYARRYQAAEGEAASQPSMNWRMIRCPKAPSGHIKGNIPRHAPDACAEL